MTTPDRLVTAFDACLRDRREPGPELLDELLDHLDDELAFRLLETLAEHVEDLAAVLVGAGALRRLAARLPGPDGVAFGAQADLELGRAAVAAGRWADAARTLTEPVEVLDGLDRALAEALLGEALHGLHREDEAVARWTSARDGFRAAGVPDGEAAATASLAAAAVDAGDRGPRVSDAFAGAADLFARAGMADQAAECAARAGEVVVDRIASLADAASGEAADLAVRAYELAHRHGAHDVAIRLATTAATYGAHAGWAWPGVRAWCTTARAEIDLADPAPEVAQRYRAGVDLTEGAAAASRAMPVAAERPLRAALAVFRRIGPREVEEFCLAQLAGMRAVTEQADPGRVPGAVDEQAWTGTESRSAAAVLRALVAVHTGAADTGVLLESAGRAVSDAGPDAEFRGVLLDLAVAASRPDDHPSLRRALGAADRFLADRAATVSPTVVRGVRMARDLTALAFAAPDEAAAVMLSVEDGLLETGAGLPAAQIAVARARALLDGGDARSALDAVLPATLALDAVRFTLDDADRRRRWNAVVARGFEIAHRAALRCGDHRTVAELLEVARANGAPTTDTDDDPLSDLIATAIAPGGAGTAGTASTGTALSGAAAVTGARTGPDPSGRTALAPPARIRAPWGGVALAGPLDRARRYHDPVRADETVDWTAAPGAVP